MEVQMEIVRFGRVFTRREFAPDELQKIRQVAAGRVVAFPKTEPPLRRRLDWTGALILFARGARAEDAARQAGCSRREVFYILKEERGIVRPRYWQKLGLNAAQIARLYGRSEAGVRRGLKG